MSVLDWVYRAVYRYGFHAARLLWRFTKPTHRGALLMLWHDDRVLLVRNSYQDVWAAPGGGIKANENAIEAVIREASEELGLHFKPKELGAALAIEHLWNNRRDKVQIFEAELSDAPKIKIDNREIVEARFFTLAEAQSVNLAPHLRDYFRTRAAALSRSERREHAEEKGSTRGGAKAYGGVAQYHSGRDRLGWDRTPSHGTSA
jgi:8-oxo-dGTP diphosphatase